MGPKRRTDVKGPSGPIMLTRFGMRVDQTREGEGEQRISEEHDTS